MGNRPADAITFDVFSALIDSRTGGSAFFADLAGERGWPAFFAGTPIGEAMYDRWDARNKSLHRDCARWVPFADLSAQALEATYRQLAVDQLTVDQMTVAADSAALLASMAHWPLWPDVSAANLRALPAARLGLLSNIDNDLLAATAVIRLGIFDPTLIVSSQTAQAYKPSAQFYTAAARLGGRIVHVASSARDVRGTLEAGLPCVRLARPGHRVDPAGPQPAHVATSIAGLGPAITEAEAEAEAPQA